MPGHTQATDEEQSAACVKFDQAISRPLPELLAYSSAATALGESEAKTSPVAAQEAWKITSGNPFITHDQRIEIANFVDVHMRALEESEERRSRHVRRLSHPLYFFSSCHDLAILFVGF